MGTSSSRAGYKAPRGGDWTRARGRVTSLTRGTGASVGATVGAFVSAIGGSRAIGTGGAGRLSSSIRTGQALGSFLSGIASGGLDQALRSIGLAHLVGAAPYDILSNIVDYIGGDGGLLDDTIARSAVVEVLAEIFDEADDTYIDLRDRWDSHLDESRIIDLMSLFLSKAIFQLFLADLGDRIESNAISAIQAEQQEQRVSEFIEGMVAFELGEIDPLNFDWQGLVGEELIQRNLDAALGQSEAYA